MYVYVCMCAHVQAGVRRPEVDVSRLPLNSLPLKKFFWGTGSLSEPEGY